MSENGIKEAEQRVREMNRMTQQYSEQGNRYLQSMMNAQNARQTRFEPAPPHPQQNIGQGSHGGFPANHTGNQQQNRQRNMQHNGNPNMQQNFRNNNCPPRGDPAGERRNLPHNNSRGNSPARNILPPLPEEHFHNEIHKNTGNQSSFPGFPDLIADNEKLMILLLIYLLMKEKADIKLILALGYLLL